MPLIWHQQIWSQIFCQSHLDQATPFNSDIVFRSGQEHDQRTKCFILSILYFSEDYQVLLAFKYWKCSDFLFIAFERLQKELYCCLVSQFLFVEKYYLVYADLSDFFKTIFFSFTLLVYSLLSNFVEGSIILMCARIRSL